VAGRVHVSGRGGPRPNFVTGGAPPGSIMGGQSDSFTGTPANRLTSFKNSHVRTTQRVQKTAENKHGSRYGYFSQNQFPNKVGNRSCGRDSDPPAKGLSYTDQHRMCCGVGSRTQL